MGGIKKEKDRSQYDHSLFMYELACTIIPLERSFQIEKKPDKCMDFNNLLLVCVFSFSLWQ